MSFSIGKNGILDPEGKYPNPLTGEPYSNQYRALSLGIPATATSPGKKGWSQYEAWLGAREILKKIHHKQIMLLVLPTGVGKTVIVPKLLLHYFGYKKRVLVTTPRHTTTSEAGRYAAQCLDVPHYVVDDNGNPIINPDSHNAKLPYYPTGNKIVGYKYAGNTKFADANTLLLFTTDGSVKQKIISGLTNKLTLHSNLEDFGGIVIDEAHERSVNIDILIALVMDILPKRPEFKVIIMSATIKETDFTDYFKRIGQGDNYTTYSLKDPETNYKIDKQKILKKIDPSNLIDVVYKKINEIILDPKLPIGNILAFVTSEAETGKIRLKIENYMANYPIDNKPFPISMYANVDEGDKDMATGKDNLKYAPPNINAPMGYHRKVIIATNALESSVTFKDSLVYVIDTGLAFEKNYNAKDYCFETGKGFVSQASILQRCGRTGRNCNGTCIQLYTTDQFDKLSTYSIPKILTEEFTNEFLSLSIINDNVSRARKFMDKLIEEPVKYEDNIKRGFQNLFHMGLVDRAGNITNLGLVCNQFRRFDIKIAKMIIGGYYLGCLEWCVKLGAILSSLESVEKIFKQVPILSDAIETKRLQQEYKENIKRLSHPSGDHITLLILFNNYLSEPYDNRNNFANDNKLNVNVLKNLLFDYKELSEILKNKQTQMLIKNLNLFSVPPEILIFGGGGDISGLNNDNTDGDEDGEDYEEGEDDTQFGGNISSDDSSSDSDSEFDSDESSSDDDSSDSSSDEDSSDSKLIISNNINNTTNTELDVSSKLNKYYKGDFQDIKENTSILSGHSRDDRKFTHKNNRKQSRRTKKEGYGNRKHNLITDTSTHLLNGGKQHTDKNKQKKDKYTRRDKLTESERVIENTNILKRQKILKLLDLATIQKTKLVPPNNLVDKILASLFYGFSNNIACYSGKKKQYNVQYSPKEGSIESSTFDFMNTQQLPNFIIYNDFTINKDMGNSGAKLNIISEFTSQHFGLFLDVNDIKKKINTE